MSEEHLHLPAVSQLRSRVESLLLVSDEPVAAEQLAEACSVDASQVEHKHSSPQRQEPCGPQT